MSVVTGTAPASVHAAGAAAAQETDQLHKTAFVTKLALKKLARAAATEADEEVKKDLAQQAADWGLFAVSNEFDAELWFRFYRHFFLATLKIHSS